MERYLMTQSLLASWLYAMKYDPNEDVTTERDSMEEFMRTLRKEPTPTTEAMQKGIDFENLVAAILAGDKIAALHKKNRITGALEKELYPVIEHPWFEGASDVAEIVRGGQLQYKVSREIAVNGMTLVLHGRLDFLKAGVIYDTKFSSSYDRGKYINSPQHPAYLELVPEAGRFTYIISNGSLVWTETYTREETPSIYQIIAAFLDWLTVSGNMNTYKKMWVAK